MDKARDYMIPGIQANIDDANENGKIFTDEELDRIADVVRERFPDIRVGDVVNTVLEDERYRNDGTLFWTGDSVINPATEPDDYGTVPPQFVVSDDDFNPHWWSDVIVHNHYWWPSDEIRDRAIAGVEHIPIPTHPNAGDVFQTHFMVGGHEYHIVFDADVADCTMDKFHLTLRLQPYNNCGELSFYDDIDELPERWGTVYYMANDEADAESDDDADDE